MNPNTNEPGFELPTPQPSGSEANGSNHSEQKPGSLEGAPQASAPASTPSTIPVPYPTQSLPPSAPKPSTVPQTPAVADDNDLIEKEWVLKAKQIVAATRNDPYTQNKEINRFKADYLKKRYNKDIKLEDA